MKVRPVFSTAIYYGYWCILMDYVDPNTNRLTMDMNPLSLQEMTKILGVSRSTVWRFLREAANRGYLRSRQVNRMPREYFVSPLYSGSECSPELYLLFQGVPELEAALTTRDKDRIDTYLRFRM